MSKPEAPEPPDPVATAGAQTAQNIGTAIAQQQLNNVNQVTPYGNLSYDQTGSYQYTDPNSGKTYDVPTYTATQTLSGDQQAIYDQNQRASQNLATLGANQSGRLDDLLSRPLGLSGLPERGDPSAIQTPKLGRVGPGPDLQSEIGDAGVLQRSIADAGPITRSYGADFSADRQRVEDALMERLNPGLDRDRGALEARLASQGIRIGSEAYSDAMDDFGRQSNDARLAAVLGAGQEQSRLTGLAAQRAGFENAAQSQAFGQNAQQAAFANGAQGTAFQQLATRAGFGNQAQQQEYQNASGATQANNQSALSGFNADLARASAQSAARESALNEAFAERNQPLNEITALMSGAQVQNPNFVNTNPAQLATTDVAGITMGAHNAEMQNYQTKLGTWNNIFGGLAGLGGGLIMASDRRAKTDIKKIGKTDDGLGLYKFRYKQGGPMQIGLMAQEVEAKKPRSNAVVEVNGLKLVNYDRALGAKE